MPRPPTLTASALRPQAGALALGAGPHRHVLLDPLARPVGVGVAVAALEVRDHSLESRHVGAPAAHPVAVGDVDALVLVTPEEEVLIVLRQLLPGHVEVDLVLVGDRLRELLVVVRAPAPGQRSRPRRSSESRVDDEVGVDLHLRAETGAARAGAVRRVEREDPRLELGHRSAAVQAGELLREDERPVVACGRGARRMLRSRPFADPPRTRPRSAAALSPRFPPQARPRSRPSRRPACARPASCTSRSTTTAMSCLNFLSSSISSSSSRSSPSIFARVKPSARSSSSRSLYSPLRPRTTGASTMKRRALGQRHHVVDDLLDRLPGDRLAADVAVRVPDAGPQQAQVVVDLGHGPDRRARVARGGLLVDRDRRREALDRVDVGLVHLAEELARVGRQRLDVAALALGVDRVEGKARLAGPGEPGHHDQRVARQLEGDVLEVVLARA